jgi:16S rRNA (cytidine1402-2'-O)-methyltransferase
VATALSAAGIAGDRYLFLGFLPRKGAERQRLLRRATGEEWSVVLFEAAPRLATLLEDRSLPAAAGRGGTGTDQPTRFGPGHCRAGGLLFAGPSREITVVVEGTGGPAPEPDRTEEALEAATELLAEGMSRREVARRLTESHGLSRNDAYRLVTGLP